MGRGAALPFAKGSLPHNILCARSTLWGRRRASGGLANSNPLLSGPGGASLDAQAFPCSPCLAHGEGATDAPCFGVLILGHAQQPQQNAIRFPPTEQYIIGHLWTRRKHFPHFASEAPMELELVIITNLVTANAMPNTAPGWSGTPSAAVPPFQRSVLSIPPQVSCLLSTSDKVINKNSKRGVGYGRGV